MKKRLLALLLAGSMALSLAACGNSNQKPADASVGSTASGSAAADGGAAPADADREEVTLSAFIMQSVTGESGIWKGWGAQKLYDDLKIKINFDPTGNEVETKLQQYLVSGQLPDIIGLKGLDQAQLAMDADMLLPLDEYKDKLPNIFENDLYTHAVQYSQDYTSNDTGHLYIMPTAVGPAGYNSLNWVPLLQWDVYKNIGMPEVQTLEDYLDVVEEMVKQKPTTDAGEKVYGFSLFSDWDNVTALEISTLSFMYGIDTEYVSPLMETSMLTRETKSLLADDSFYKRALKFYFDANQRGLLDPDSMSQTYSDTEAKFSAGRVMFSWFSWLAGTYNDRPNQDNPEKPDGMASVVAKDMKLYKAPEQTIGRSWYFGISKDCSNVDAALELLNWLYDVDIAQYLSNGPQGVTWDYDENKEPQVIDWNYSDKKTELLMPEDIGGGAFQDGVYAFNTLGPQAATVMPDGFTLSYRYWPCTLNRNPSLMKQEVADKLQEGDLVLEEYLKKSDRIAESTQAVNMITPASDDLEIIITQIGEIVKKYSWQMVYAKDEAEFESLWKTMTTQAQQLGLDQVTEFYTSEWTKACEIVKNYE